MMGISLAVACYAASELPRLLCSIFGSESNAQWRKQHRLKALRTPCQSPKTKPKKNPKNTSPLIQGLLFLHRGGFTKGRL